MIEQVIEALGLDRAFQRTMAPRVLLVRALASDAALVSRLCASGCDVHLISREAPESFDERAKVHPGDYLDYLNSRGFNYVFAHNLTLDLVDCAGSGFKFGRFGVNGPSSDVIDSLGALEYAHQAANDIVIVEMPLGVLDQSDYIAREGMLKNIPLAASIDNGIHVLSVWLSSLRSTPSRPLRHSFNPFSHAAFSSLWAASNWPHSLHDVQMHLAASSKRPPLSIDYSRRQAYFTLVKQPPSAGDHACRIVANGNASGIRIKPLNAPSEALLMVALNTFGQYKHMMLNKSVPRSKFILRLKFLMDDSGLFERVVKSLESAGLRVEVDDQVKRWLAKERRRQGRYHAHIERAILDPELDSWIVRHDGEGIRTTHKELYEHWLGKVDRLVPWPLWDFQREDVALWGVKRNAIEASFVGSGKTRMIFSGLQMFGGKRNLIVLESKLIREMMIEAEKLGIPKSDFLVIKKPEDVKRLRRINLISYNTVWKPIGERKRLKKTTRSFKASEVELQSVATPGLMQRFRVELKRSGGVWVVVTDSLPEGWRIPTGKTPRSVLEYKAPPNHSQLKTFYEVEADEFVEGEPCKTMAHLLRRTRFNMLAIDEAHRLKGGQSTKQGKYTQLLRAKHVVCLTGTVIKSYPRNIYPLLVRTGGGQTTQCEWSYVHDMPKDWSRVTTSTRVFAEKFVQVVDMSDEFKDSLEKGRKSREIPMVPAAALPDWFDMIERLVIRRQRHEPLVSKAIKMPQADIEELFYPIDQPHALFYQWWLDEFAKWFEEQQESERAGEGFDYSGLLAQLSKLQFAAVYPQAPEVQIKGVVEWQGGLTTRQTGVLDGVIESVQSGARAIIFTERPGLVDLMKGYLLNRDVLSIGFHGGIEMQKRLNGLDKFRRDDDYSVLIMSRGCGQNGFNISCVDEVWSMDWSWTPSSMEQAEGRMLRPDWLTNEREQQGMSPRIYRTIQEGTIDLYMRQLVLAKRAGIDQAMDHQEAKFDIENWKSYRQFSEDMLRDLGLLTS